MSSKTVYISGAGIISPLGLGLDATEQCLLQNRSAVKALDLFYLQQGNPLPVGQVRELEEPGVLPRTHRLALIAANQAMVGCDQPPDAIVLGTTTGGILTTEQLLQSQESSKNLYQYHGLNTVADHLARKLHCCGPALIVSTACSSGAVAITLAFEMLRQGEVQSVLAGGVDSLSRLTYFGFNSLQLVDSAGCRPLDKKRQGMVVSEGAGMLLLTTKRPEQSPLGELLGAGISCDAYHPATPHPEGIGAAAAMTAALAGADLNPKDIDYISLHGTGTLDNDLMESKALHSLFSPLPSLSSIKGASGHTLAAAGAIEAVVSLIAVSKGVLPANTGLTEVDPALELHPLIQPERKAVKAVLSNSFGFGGNNGSVVVGAVDTFSAREARASLNPLSIHGYSCLTGAGGTRETMDILNTGSPVMGMTGQFSTKLPPRLVRRLKRLPRMSLALAVEAHNDVGTDAPTPKAIFMGTGWGALSETHDFLTRLKETKEQFPSPIDFVGSVHNGPASQIAMLFGATGANITTSGGDYSFEQALMAADLMITDTAEPALVLGADEGHDTFSPLFDPSIFPGVTLADGGGAFFINREKEGAICSVSMPFYQSSRREQTLSSLVAALGGKERVKRKYPLVLVGIPAANRDQGYNQLEQFFNCTGLDVPVIHYRQFTGEFAAASAVAAAIAVSLLKAGRVPGTLTQEKDILLDTSIHTILVLGLGSCITAMEFSRS